MNRVPSLNLLTAPLLLVGGVAMWGECFMGVCGWTKRWEERVDMGK